MIEVFKTNVNSRLEAIQLLEQIHRTCPGYKANFDLEDCDRILRVVHSQESINAAKIIRLLRSKGFTAQVLDDDLPSGQSAFATIYSQTI